MSGTRLGRWVRAVRAQAARFAGSETLGQENKQLRAQLARAEIARVILKKALTLFSQPAGRRNASRSLPYVFPTGPCGRSANCWASVLAAITPGGSVPLLWRPRACLPPTPGDTASVGYGSSCAAKATTQDAAAREPGRARVAYTPYAPAPAPDRRAPPGPARRPWPPIS